MDSTYIVALEISGTQVKGAIAQAKTSAYAPLAIPQIDGIVTDDKVNCVQYGRVQNLIEAASHLGHVLQKLENHPTVGRGHINGAYVALGGRSLGSMQATAELPLPHEMVITNDILKHLFAEATKTVPGDKKLLKVVPRKYYVDNQPALNPVGSMGTKIRGEFTLVTCSPANQRNLDLVLGDRLHLEVKEYVVTPLAMAQMVLGEEEKQLGCVLVDLGAQTTTLSIYKDRSLQALVTLPLGAFNITHDIAVGCNVTDEHAESMKLTHGNAMPEMNVSDTSAAMNCYVQARAAEIIANIIAQIEYAGFKAADLSAGFIVAGRGAKLKNFVSALEKQSKMKARLASVPDTVRMQATGISPYDYIPLISIAAYAAVKPGVKNCVEMPKEQKCDELPGDGHSGSFDPYENGDDDENLLLDDDEVELRKANAAQKQQKEAEKAEKEAQRKQEIADKKAQKAAEDKARAEIKKKKQSERRSLLSRMRETFTNFVGSDDDDSADLDEN